MMGQDFACGTHMVAQLTNVLASTTNFASSQADLKYIYVVAGDGC